jgi:hypothetical protein
MKKLGGWTRIGVVASVVWFLGFAGYIWHSNLDQLSEHYGSSLHLCSTMLDMADESLQQIQNLDARNTRQSANLATYEKCQNRARDAFFHLSDANTSKEAISVLLAIDLGTVVVGWLLVLSGVGVSRWVRRGFA